MQLDLSIQYFVLVTTDELRTYERPLADPHLSEHLARFLGDAGPLTGGSKRGPLSVRLVPKVPKEGAIKVDTENRNIAYNLLFGL